MFSEDTYIKTFSNSKYQYSDGIQGGHENICSKWIFYFVKDQDWNNSGRIDENDPYILYISDINGKNLKALTSPDENVVSLKIFDIQGYALVRIQKDTNNDKKFDTKDKDYYYAKLDLNTLTFGNKIEVNP